MGKAKLTTSCGVTFTGKIIAGSRSRKGKRKMTFIFEVDLEKEVV
jgi:hypothetical protein